MRTAAGRSPRLAYPVRLEPAEEGGFVATFPDFGVGVTQGDTHEEALTQAADLLETMVANYMAESWELPKPSAARGRPLVRLEPIVAAKAELYRAMKAAGIGKEELAQRIGMAPDKAERLFSIHHELRLDRIDAALAALGRRLVVTTEAA